MEQIAVIGAGTMGNGIAHVFAQNGYKVNLVDISQASLDKGMATITKNLDRMISKEVIDGTKKEATLSNITTYTNFKEGVSDSDLVVEAATENLDIKLKIFSDRNALYESCTHYEVGGNHSWVQYFGRSHGDHHGAVQKIGQNPDRGKRLPRICGQSYFDAHDQRIHRNLVQWRGWR